ncbi:MAG TPA: DinB family protein [Ignavibacteria bacterium]|nr:DinB family protein [Ignavibacteria bacterium]
MKKADIKVMPKYYDTYINEVENIDLSDALIKYGPNLLEAEKEHLTNIGNKVYTPGKWTVKEIIQHLIDSERVFNYRALRFARNDKTVLPGYEENDYAKESNADSRSIEDLLTEFANLRRSTLDMFNSFDDEMLQREGICFNTNVSVLALGFVLAGHVLHHTNVIREKYFSL